MKRLLTVEGEKLQKSLEFSENNSFIPHNEYPRPTLFRNSYLNLNGIWKFGIVEKNNQAIKEPVYDKEILVPFPIESILSGIEKHYSDGTELHYSRDFYIEKEFINKKIILNIGAIDQCSTVYINGSEVGYHIGGYSSFSFDITDFISVGKNNIHICCVDNLNSLILPYGKQREKRGGMWYTPVSGIWQTVWIESVPENYIKKVDFETEKNIVSVKINDGLNGKGMIETKNGNVEFSITDGCGKAKINNPEYWSPENPYLYNVTIKTDCDEIKSYFAFRTLEIKSINGINRLCLNGKPYFFHGLLDQGYWSDGIYTPASDKAFIDDIMFAKKMGFNMLRKHIKTEPERFYYYCDKLGIVVFQDMINNSDYSFFRDTFLPTIGVKNRSDKNLHKNSTTRKVFTESSERIVNDLKKHPSICLWTIFNEGWGQFSGNIMYEFIKSLDDTRFIDTASGWFTCSESDVESIHTYFKKYKHKKSNKPVFLSEFGGYSFKLKEHSFNTKKTYGYGKFSSESDFTKAVENLYYNEIIPSIPLGLCATVYTQLSDVEDETNGFITYDRKVAKISSDNMKEISEKIFEANEKLINTNS